MDIFRRGTLNVPNQNSDGGLSKAVGQVLNKPQAQTPKPAEPAPLKPTGAVTTGRDPDEGTVLWYRQKFAIMTYDPGTEARIRAAAQRVRSGRARYEVVEKRTDVPWFVLGALHNMEASCSFAGVLHNGERIIGTGRKTTLVPKGRGPFSTWEEAAIDAISLNGSRWARLRSGSRDIGDILYACERFNGAGYLTGAGKAETSPYLWACTSINDGRGKYVADGKFDPNADSNGQVGVAAILKELLLAGEIKLEGVAA
jgi:lysozyme family protein